MLVSAEFGPPSSLVSLNAYAAHWRLALDRFPTLKHFLADFRSFCRLVHDDDSIPLDSSFWTKVLAATMRRDHSDKVSEWIKLKPDDLLNILDGIAATKQTEHNQNPKKSSGPKPGWKRQGQDQSQKRSFVGKSVQRVSEENTPSPTILDSAADVHVVTNQESFTSYSPSTAEYI